MSIAVLLVDDEELVRVGIKTTLEADPDMSVVAEAADGAAALSLVLSHQPDVVVMDIRMRGMDGLTATRRISDLPRPPKVVVLTTFDVDEYVYDALRAGAAGFLLKDTPPRDLARAVKLIHHGEAMLAPSVTRRLITKFARRGPTAESRDRIAGLTDRERAVWRLVSQGLSNAEIGSALHLAEATVKTHVRGLLTKLDCNRVQAAVLAHEVGLLDE
ncbi:response regulator transcription factor [Streptomyces sp. NBC_01481]|uniref:response regulator n=1 Tax=Streptomyces sp. NBC_01481 TaxID=2975869 RepID=UPI002251CF29|nr:response regulator transcription factor [Streptomyces sp. NBC_01481]MCX4586069.1 response regulator transcription factor [Streptomyces sp. NBC_01481]